MVHYALQMLLSFGHGLPYLIPIAQQVTKITQPGATRLGGLGGWWVCNIDRACWLKMLIRPYGKTKECYKLFMLFKATEGCHKQLCKVWPRPVQAFLPLKEWVFKKTQQQQKTSCCALKANTESS